MPSLVRSEGAATWEAAPAQDLPEPCQSCFYWHANSWIRQVYCREQSCFQLQCWLSAVRAWAYIPCSFAAVKSCSLFPRKRLPEMVLELAEWHSPRETCRRAYLCSRRFWKGPEEAPAKWFLKSQLQVVPPALKQHLCHKEETKSSCGDNCDQCWGLEPFKTWLTFNKLSQGRV